jgi:hypothetical protein
MESQKFPVRHYYAGGNMIRPYDITSWSLPLHRGVEAIEINTKYHIPEEALRQIEVPFGFSPEGVSSCAGMLFSAKNNESYKAAFLASEKGFTVKRITGNLILDGEEFPAGSFYITSRQNLESLADGLLVRPRCLQGEIETEAVELSIPRIALVESWFHDMDAGWTRYLFSTHTIFHTGFSDR